MGQWEIQVLGDANAGGRWYGSGWMGHNTTSSQINISVTSGYYISSAYYYERHEFDSYWTWSSDHNEGYSGWNIPVSHGDTYVSGGLSCPQWSSSNGAAKWHGGNAETRMFIKVNTSIRWYWVSVNEGGGSVGWGGGNYTHGSGVHMPSSGSRTGYSLSHFTTSAGHHLSRGQHLTITQGLTIYTHWSINQYNYSINLNGGTVSNYHGYGTGNYNYGSQIKLPSVYRTGWSLSSYKIGNTNLSQGQHYNIPANNIVLNVNWVINSYNYSINLNGGSISNYYGYGTGNYNYGTQIRLASVSRTGHSLSSYKIGNTNLSQGQHYNIPANNIVLNVNWTINQYSFTINHDNDDIASSGNNSITTSYTLNWNTHVNLSNYNGILQSKKGHSHTGWSTNSFNIPDNNNTVITALWSINQYNFYIDHNNDDIAISGVNKSANTVISGINYNTLINLSSYNNRVIYKKGHSHTGWSTNSFNIPDNNNTVISALWTVNKYNIILSSDNINSVHYNKKILNESTYYERDYNSTIVIENPKVIGYNFKEWVPDENNIESSFTNSKHYNEDFDRNYYASWEIKRNGIVKFKDLEDTFKIPSENEIKFSDYINNLELKKNISFREHVKGKGIKEVVS